MPNQAGAKLLLARESEAATASAALSPDLTAPSMYPLHTVAVSALLIVVDFNYLRKHGTERDAIWLATGIFVSILNIFVSLLNLTAGD